MNFVHYVPDSSLIEEIVFYEVDLVDVDVRIPSHLINKSADEIVAYLMNHYKIKSDKEGRLELPVNLSTAYLMAVRDVIFDPDNWKNAIYVRYPKIQREWVKAAIVWYHGSIPIESMAGVYSTGYACG